MDRPEFEAVMGAKLDAIDTRNRTGYGRQAGRPISWTARQVEALLMYRRFSGISTVKRTRERLTVDHDGRTLLGLDPIPSAPTITRYLRQHFTEEERASLWRQLERALRDAVCQLPGFDDEARILGMDGSKIEIRYTPPSDVLDPVQKVTAPEAGWVGKTGGPKTGRGFQMVAVWTEHGTPLAWDISALSSSEYPAAERALDRYRDEVLPHRGNETLSVLTADGGFSSATIRRACQEMRIVPNIHRASHGDAEDSKRNVAKLTKTRYPLDEPLRPAYEKWAITGLGDLVCDCGDGHVERDIKVKNGKLSIASVGRCKTCGNVRVTAGKWHHSQSGRSKVVPCLPGEQGDPFYGNPLTFTDRLAHEYGQDRFGWNESLHQTLKARFGLLKDKCWMRRRAEVEIEFATAFAGIHALRLERQRRLDLVTPAAGSASPSEAASAVAA